MIKQPQGGDWPKLGKVIDEYVHKVDLDGRLLWEEKLRLHIKPRPAWCPETLWYNEDLKKLKEEVKRRNSIFPIDPKKSLKFSFSWEQFKALLVRLEAAENFMKRVLDEDDPGWY